MCSGGGDGALMGAILGGVAAYMTGGASLGLTAGTAGAAAAGAAGGALAGDTLVDKPMALQKSAAEAANRVQTESNQIAKQALDQQVKQAESQTVKAESRNAETQSMRDANALNAKGGQSGTMLTGPTGVDPMSLLLGRKTLLGG